MATFDEHAAAMDRIYRHQRRVYDASRRLFLVGRDRLIEDLQPRSGDHVLEIGCGTARNLVRIARRYPGAVCYGLDASQEMLKSARAAVERSGLTETVTLAHGDAAAFDPAQLFGRPKFDRVVFSYALSMIPPWREALAMAWSAVATGGSLHIVDFGRQGAWPGPAKALLRGWLARFTVVPRDELVTVLQAMAADSGSMLSVRSSQGGFAVYAVLRRPDGRDDRSAK